MSITAFAVAFIALTALIVVSGINSQIKEEIALVGVFQTCLLILSCIAFVCTFIAVLWILYGFGFY